MQGIVFSINLKQKFKNQDTLNIKYFLKKRLNKSNIKDQYFIKKCDYVILENIVIEDKDFILNYLINKDKKVIVLTTNQKDKNAYQNYKGMLVLNVLEEKFVEKIDSFIKEKKEIINYNFLEKIKVHKNIIIGFSLDHKVNSSKYLLELSNILSEINEVVHLEKDNSLLRDYNFSYLNNKQINYKKFSIIEDIEEEIDQKIVIIDYGIVLEQKKLKELLNYKNIVVFTRKNNQLIKSNRYLKTLKEIEEKNKALIIEYNEINSRINKIQIRKIRKHIYKNINI